MLTSAYADSLANWSLIESSTNSVLTCVIYDGSAFMAAGADDSGDLILRSDDGASWSRLSSPLTNGWLAALAYGEGTYVIVGSQGAILRSTNGTTWTLARMADDEDLRAVTYGHGFFMAGGQDSYQAVILTSPDGATWSPQLLGAPGNYDWVTSLAFGDGAFLAGTYYGSLWRSVDGTNWAQLSPQANGFLGGITFGPDLAVAVGGWTGGMFSAPAATILTSRDGIDWQTMADSTSSVLTAVAYGNGFYVAVDSSGAIHSSEDGSCWFPRFNSTSRLYGIAFGSRVFVAVGESGTILRSAPIDPNTVRLKFSSCQPYSVGEPDGQITIPVRRVGDTNGSVTVRYTTANGEALAGQDYESTEGSLTFAPGETEQKITARILDDNVPEGTETFAVSLLEPGNGAELSKPDSATIQILDDDSSHLDHWCTLYPQLSASDLRGVAYDGSAFVAVGNNFAADPSLPGWNVTVLRSTDGRSWEDASPGIAGTPRGFCWGGGNFVAVGFRYDTATGAYWQQILSSPDGLAWRETPMAIQGDLERISYGNGRFVAVGSELQAGQSVGEIMTSADGLNWTKVQGLKNIAPLSSVAWGNGVFLAVGSSESSYGSWTNYCLSSSDGTNWTLIRLASGPQAAGVTYGNGLFVLAGNDYARVLGMIFTSPDGKTWTPQFAATNLWLDLAAYLNGSFLVTGTDSSSGDFKSVLLKSSDGSSWNFNSSLPANNGEIGVAYGSGLYVLAGPGIWSSPDTLSWQEQVPARVDLLDITYGAELFVAVGSKIFTSQNGTQWTIRAKDPPSPLGGVVYGSGLFVALAADGTIMSSRNGIDWTSRPLGTNVLLSRATFGQGQFVAIGGLVGDAGYRTNRVFVSTNGFDWKPTYADSTVSPSWNDLTFGKDFFVAVGAEGSIFTSPDGVSWTSRPSGISDQINAVTFGRGLFVAVGGSTHPDKWTYTTSVILTSPDGLTWTSLPLPWSIQGPYFYGWPLTGVVYGGDTFVAVGTGDMGLDYYGADVIVTSPDGVNWTARLAEPGPGLSRIATGNGHLVVVGQGGRVLRPGVVLNITSLPTATSPALGLSIGGEIGLRHSLQVSTNLQDWNTLATLTSTNFNTRLEDPQAGLHPRRFYRTKEGTQ